MPVCAAVSHTGGVVPVIPHSQGPFGMAGVPLAWPVSPWLSHIVTRCRRAVLAVPGRQQPVLTLTAKNPTELGEGMEPTGIHLKGKKSRERL